MKRDPEPHALQARIRALELELEQLRALKNGTESSTSTLPNLIDVGGIDIEWRLEDGVCTFAGLPVAMMWVGSTLAGLMAGVQTMVGTERFALALQSQGRNSVTDDWRVISHCEDFRDGFAAIANIAAVAGWGHWELTKLDREAREGVFRVRDSWEASYQRTLGVSWGSAMLAGKLAGYCSRLFDTNCWADQTSFLADGDAFDEFVVRPSERSLEAEIEGLLASDDATKADMAVALQKLRHEIAERLHAEQALRRAHGELELRVTERTAELARINEQLQQDILARRQAQAALRDSEDRFRTMAEVSPLPLAIMNNEGGRPEYFNPAFVQLFGWELLEVPTLEAWLSAVYPDPDYRARVIRIGTEDLAPTGATHQREFRVTCRDGTQRDIVWRMAPLDSARQLIVAEDLTEIRRVQEEREALTEKLHRSRKMEALGLLAGGVAHDLNNILSGIVSFPDLLLSQVEDDSQLRRPLEVIHASGLRAAAVVQDLLAIARGAASAREVTKFNGIVEDYLGSAEVVALATSRPAVRIEPDLAPRLFNVNCSPVHLRKLVMNLVSNAAEAIQDQGTIVVKTRNRYLDRPLKGYDQIEIGEFVVLSVSDDGVGVEEQDLERIFEPFFTRKVLQRSGTGLGLAVVWNTVRDHDGYINVTSSKAGSCFEIFLPATREQVQSETGAESAAAYQGQGQRVLVIDDEEQQREIAALMLEQLGYQALVAAGGAEACELLKRESVDLLVLDMIMPNGWCGRQTYDKILQLRPGQRAVLASGYAETDEVRETQRLGAGAFLKKPYGLEELGLAVRDELRKA